MHPTHNTFVVREVDNGWIVEINGSVQRMEPGTVRVYQHAWELEQLFKKHQSKTRQKLAAARPVSL